MPRCRFGTNSNELNFTDIEKDYEKIEQQVLWSIVRNSVENSTTESGIQWWKRRKRTRVNSTRASLTWVYRLHGRTMRKKIGKQWIESADTFIFSLFLLRTFEGCSPWTAQKLILVLSDATFEKLLENIQVTQCLLFGVLGLLLFGKCNYIFVAYHDKSCCQNKYSAGQANQAQSAKFEKSGIVPFSILSLVLHIKNTPLGFRM